MHKKGYTKRIAAVLVLTMVIQMLPVGMVTEVFAASWTPVTEQPILVVTGSAVVGGNPTATDLTENIANERAYTLDELKAMAVKDTALYSSMNSAGTKRVYKTQGVSLDELFKNTAFNTTEYGKHKVSMIASDGMTATFDPTHNGNTEGGNTAGTPPVSKGLDAKRYYYPGLNTGSPAGAAQTPVMLSLKYKYENAPTVPADHSLEEDTAAPRLIVGQLAVNDVNNPMYNQKVQKIIAGSELANVLKIGSDSYSRAEILLLPRVIETYTYQTQGGEKTEAAQGVPFVNLLSGYQDKDEVEFISADGYANEKMTVGQLREDAGKYILAYAKGENTSSLKGIYDTAKNDEKIHGYFTIYSNGNQPVKMVSEIKIHSLSVNYSDSPFKHITNGGLSGQSGPFNIDAITGATLTVEGSGVEASVPVSVRQLETENGGVFRGEYTDIRDGEAKTLTYEGIKLSHILKNMGDGSSGIKLTDTASKVVIKNLVRQTIAQFTLSQIEEAENNGSPILVAYGTSDGSSITPFVYDLATGIVPELGNDDGCIKLIYNKSSITGDLNESYVKFANMAYIYVEEGSSPGYKHDKYPYNTPENSQYVITITGAAIGREVNYTVEQLENMVAYGDDGLPAADGMGYRDEYSLANSNYWYVNEYEGVKLWDLLNKAGLNTEDMSKKVTFRAADGYVDFDTFTLEQISNPDMFGYYEKNALDESDGKYISQPGDLIDSGYPVLVSYGLNNYPYVIKNTLNGFKSGLGNDGGPVRIISGKTEYTHANGSKQAKLLDKIIVGEEINYSTHKANPDYTSLSNQAIKIEVTGIDGKMIKTLDYTVADIENIVYGENVSNQQKQEARIKDFYGVKKGETMYSDLYEGINFQYLLEEIVQIPGNKGTVEFTVEGQSEPVIITIDDAFRTGGNEQSKKTDLASIIAFAKNGYPMVAEKESDGYISSYEDGMDEKVNVKNDGGPIAFITPSVDGEIISALNINSIKVNLEPDKYSHVDEPYSGLAGNTLTITGEGVRASKTISVADIEGRQSLAETHVYNIKDETDEIKLRYRGINLYNLLRQADIGLKSNARDVTVKTSSGAEYTFSLNEVMKSDYLNAQTGENDLKMILAYGSADAVSGNKTAGKPLVKTDKDAGYDAAHKNSGGPLMLIVGQTSAEDNNKNRILEDVIEIHVSAVEQGSWNHSANDVYSQFLNEEYVLRIVNQANETVLEKTYTLKSLEEMTGLMVRDEYTYVGTHIHEGIDLWKFVLQEASHIPGVEAPIAVNAIAGDGFSRDLISTFSLDALNNGIKDGEARKIIILSYAIVGKPLVNAPSDMGYESGNDGGPVRLITHNNQGSCLKDIRTVEVVVETGASAAPSVNVTAAAEPVVFTMKHEGGDTGYTVDKLRTSADALSKDYKWFNKDEGKVVTDSVKGIMISALVSQNDEISISMITADGYDDKGNYNNIPSTEIVGKEYFVAFEVNGSLISDDVKGSDEKTAVRIYRNIEAGTEKEPEDWRNRVTNIVAVETSGEIKASEEKPAKTAGKSLSGLQALKFYAADGKEGNLPLSGIRSIVPDGKGGMWVGTYGAGAAYIAADSTIIRYNTESEPALKSNFVVDIAIDADGGVWMTQSGTYEPDGKSYGIAHLYENEFTYYDTSTENTLPHDYVQRVKIDGEGNVWMASFGGLTKFSPKDNSFRTWTKDDGLPAISVDNFCFDNKGGVWIGMYPDENNGEYSGGYAYLISSGAVKAFAAAGSEDADVAPELLADYWVRSIAVDEVGGAYVIRSGSYSTLENVGGRLDYIDPYGTITRYLGKDIIPELGTKANENFNPEIRIVEIDESGNLWIGTSGLGIYMGKDVHSLTNVASSNTGAWPEGSANDNIYVLTIADGKAYVGSSGGAAILDTNTHVFIPLQTAGEKSLGTERTHWALENMDALGNAGLPTSDSKSADSPISAREVANLLVSAMGIEAEDILSGIDKEQLSREYLISILFDISRQMGILTENGSVEILDRFTDKNDIKPENTGAISWAVHYDIVVGDDRGYINPENTATKGEGYSMILRFLKRAGLMQ